MKQYLYFMHQQWAALLFGFLAVFGGSVGQSFFVGLFGAGIRESLSLNASQYSGAYSLATLASAATVVWLGGLIDRVTLHAYTALVCSGLCVAAVLLSQADNFIWLLAGFYLLRLFGQALLPHAGSTAMARAFTQHRGKALSIAGSGFPVGEILLPAIAGWLILRFGWQQSYLYIGLCILLGLLPLLLWLIRRSGIDTSQAGATASHANPVSGARRALFSDRRYWLALPGLMAGPFIVTGLFIHQHHLLLEKNWSLAWFTACFAVYGGVHWFSSLATGVLVDRLGAVRLLSWFPLPLAAAVLAVGFVPGDMTAVLMMAGLALGVGAAPIITGALWPEIYGIASIGRIRSVNMAIMVLATALSPFLYGLLIDRGVSLGAMMTGTAAYALLSCLLLRLSYPADPAMHPVTREEHQAGPKA